ncbi:MAG TPA: hypothetical protein VFP84_25035 [Kofleriaceae bacterium]|nr:hypothetical protein [Kofleriaceae bacterium]
MKHVKQLAVVLALAVMPATASAWEPQTTHAGLAEQAALASRLHKRLVSLGFTGGLFEPLTIPPADAPALASALKQLSPTHGAVPDARGRQSALGWLTAGAALADVPASQGANHFFDPVTGEGWSAPSRGVRGLFQAALPDHGVPAPDWVVDKANPFNLEQFLSQYAKAVSAATPGERSRAMAAALIAAGAMLHTLGDLGAPSRVRSDEAAHLELVGAGGDDRGSRFERIAALTYGRLGVPPPSRTITRSHLREFFTAGTAGRPGKPGSPAAKDAEGLADLIARSYFSPNTLPEPTVIRGDARPQLARPQPGLPARLNLMAANRDDGTTLRSPAGTCLARYRVEHDLLSFSIDDDCMLEQLAVILPDVAAYEAGLLDFLLRGELTITADGQITITGANLGAGTLDVFAEDERGVRSKLSSAATSGGEQLAQLPVPSGARIVAVFRGNDAAGEPIVAVGALALGAGSPSAAPAPVAPLAPQPATSPLPSVPAVPTKPQAR